MLLSIQDRRMDAVSKTESFFAPAIIAVLVAAFAVTVGYMWWRSCKTMPSYESFQNAGPNMAAAAMEANPEATTGVTDSVQEGFAGPARGSGAPDCLRTSADAAKVYELLSSKVPTTEEGPDDLREMALILGKISCFKRDLTGTAGVVEATRGQPFSTSHDMEPVAETTARCFAKTIPQRDLQLSLDKWGSRGTFLIKRLCTSMNLSGGEEKEALESFGRAMADLADIAIGRCCGGDVKIAGKDGPRMVGGYEPPVLSSLREYGGYY
jgi:hypothetical protein